MAQIILLNGPAGVGKTTIGKLLAKHLNESVCISGDVLKEFIINRTENVHRRMGYKNGATLVNNFINAGYKNIIFEYVFPSNEQIEYFIQELETGLNPIIFTLWASLETLQQRDAKRIGRIPLGQQISKCHEEMFPFYDNFENIINTENVEPETVVKKILQRI